jgi:competence protein ComEC
VAVAAGVGAGVALAVASKRARRLGPLVCVAALALGSTLAGLRAASLDRAALAAGARTGADALIEGQILDDPLPLGRGEERMLVGVHRAEIDGSSVRVRERVLLTVRGGPRLAAGDRIRADTRLGPLSRPGAPPEVRASAARHRRNGVAARAYAREHGVTVIGRAKDPLSVVARIGRDAVAKVSAGLPPRERGLLMGMTIGDTSRLDVAVQDEFRTTGLSHITAVSGANVAMFLGAIAAGLKLAGAGRRTTVLTMAIALLAFMAITRFEPSVLRAGAMTVTALAGLAVGARREAITALGVAALGLLVYDPFLVYSIGFQLSLLATLGILLIAPRLAAAMRGGKFAAAVGVTLGAQVAVAPLLAMRFQKVSIAALPANMLAIPAVAPATVLGFFAAAAELVFHPAGAALATAARPALAWLMGVASTFSRVPSASVGIPGGALGTIAILGLCALPFAAIRLRRMRGAPVVLAFALLASTTVWARALEPPRLDGLTLTALSVGQGDAWLVRTPRGATMLVDGGPDPALILSKLRAHGVRRIDLLVLTHPHADHVDGLAAVAANITVGRALEPGLDADLASLRELRTALLERSVPLDIGRRGASYALGEAVVDLLGPREPLFQGTDSDLNNNSIVLRIRFGSTCVLMSGEVQEEGQEALLRDPKDLPCPVMTVPHHGSRRMLPEYFQAVGARFAMISVGPNTFGHPSGQTLGVLASLHVRVLRTDLSGDVSVGVTDAGVAVREEHAPRRAA